MVNLHIFDHIQTPGPNLEQTWLQQDLSDSFWKKSSYGIWIPQGAMKKQYKFLMTSCIPTIPNTKNTKTASAPLQKQRWLR